jgi:hypothetical protein
LQLGRVIVLKVLRECVLRQQLGGLRTRTGKDLLNAIIGELSLLSIGRVVPQLRLQAGDIGYDAWAKLVEVILRRGEARELACVFWGDFAHHLIPALVRDENILLGVGKCWRDVLGVVVGNAKVHERNEGRKVNVGGTCTLG